MRAYKLFNNLTSVLKNQLCQGVDYHVKYTLSSRYCSTLMRAVCVEKYGGPSVLKLNQVSIPAPSDTEVLVKVHAAGINPVDVFAREGTFQNLPPLPQILGKEVAGIVEAVGQDVNKFKVGDRVACYLPVRDGGYADYVTCEESKIMPLVEKLSFSQGAALYVAYLTAYRALITKCNIRQGDLLLVHGASGAVGVAAVQFAKARGLKVVGTASTDAGLETAKKAGADSVFNHCNEDHLAKLYSVTNNKGYDVILENCAENNLGNDFLILAHGGRIAVVGTRIRKRDPVNPNTVEVDPKSLMYTEGIVHGVNIFKLTEEEFQIYSKAIISGAEEGWLKPIIGQEFKLEQAPEAHKRLMEIGACGKLVFNLTI